MKGPLQNKQSHEDRTPTTLAEITYRFHEESNRSELEAFRVKYEARFGETDLTRRYTSTLPTVQQQWLFEHYPERYWNGLPPFVQAFFKERMETAGRSGYLDYMPAQLISLLASGKLKINREGPSR